MDNAHGTTATASDSDASRTESNGNSKPQRPAKAKPAKVLPTDRIVAIKQLEIIRAYGISSGAERKPVTNADAANIVGLMQSTIAQTNSFFTDVGFLIKTDTAGAYMPSTEVFDFCRAHEWKPENASHKLAPLIAKSWFAQRLIPKLSFRELSEDAALADLAEEANAGQDRKSQIEMLLFYLEAANLITRQDGVIRKAQAVAAVHHPHVEPPKPNLEQVSAQSGGGSSSPPPAAGSMGGVSFNVSIQTDMAEIAKWSPERIAAFFSGLAQVISAKQMIEGEK